MPSHKIEPFIFMIANRRVEFVGLARESCFGGHVFGARYIVTIVDGTRKRVSVVVGVR